MHSGDQTVGEIYSLRSDITDDAGSAIVSAMALMAERAAELLWPVHL